jgi:hypothetical protein
MDSVIDRHLIADGPPSSVVTLLFEAALDPLKLPWIENLYGYRHVAVPQLVELHRAQALLLKGRAPYPAYMPYEGVRRWKLQTTY